ncbi:MAG: hypothetical protein AAFO58_11765, partial [Pseudomonadota bacterium]
MNAAPLRLSEPVDAGGNVGALGRVMARLDGGTGIRASCKSDRCERPAMSPSNDLSDYAAQSGRFEAAFTLEI